MNPEAIVLNVRHPAGDGSYRFRCPSCSDSIEKAADRKIIALLVSAGVDMGDLREANLEVRPDEDLEPRPASDRPGFTMDDILEFHFLLQDDEALARALLSS
jgi:hypothetical protein